MGPMSREGTRGAAAAWSIAPRLVRGAPPSVLVVVGALSLLVGLLIVTRPLTSLVLLTIYIGLSAVFSGVARLLAAPESPLWSRAVFGGAWLLVGLAMLIGLGRTLELLPALVAVLLLVGGLASAYDALARGRVSERALSAALAIAQIVFGILSIAWPDVTVLLVAIVFGIRTILFGATLLVRAVRAFVEGRRTVPDATAAGADASGGRSDVPAPRTVRSRRAWLAAGRFALAGLLLTAAGGGWWANAWLVDGAPVVDAFYDPPEVVPYEHGRLIRVAEFPGQEPRGAQVHRILYTTRDAVGQPAVASGLVIVPDETPPGARPVIAWNHGTTGVARGCAPSLRDASATKWAIPALDEVIAKGWIVVASDYTGQGAPGVFPYLIGRGEARSSLDAVLAAQEIEGLVLSTRTIAWGHSQGGHAALWMSQIAEKYAPQLEMLGVAALAPAGDPLSLAEELTAGDANVLLSILISWVLVPYADTYDDVELSRYVAPGAQTIVREMTQRCPEEPGVMVSVATALGVAEDRPLYVGDLTAGALGRRLGDNAALGPWPHPLLIAWGDQDEVIPPHLQQEYVDRLCAEGVQIRRLVYRGYDHLGTLLPSSRFLPVLVKWTDQRLGYAEPPVDDCTR